MTPNPTDTEVFITGPPGSGVSTAVGNLIYLSGAFDNLAVDILSEETHFDHTISVLDKYGIMPPLVSPAGRTIRLYTDRSYDVTQSDKLESCKIVLIVVTEETVCDVKDLIERVKHAQKLIVLVNKMDEYPYDKGKWLEEDFLRTVKAVCKLFRKMIDELPPGLDTIRFVPTAGLYGEGLISASVRCNKWRTDFRTFLRVDDPDHPEILAITCSKLSVMGALDLDAARILV